MERCFLCLTNLDEIVRPIRTSCCGGVHCESHLSDYTFTDQLAMVGCPLCRRTVRPILKCHVDAFKGTTQPGRRHVTVSVDGHDHSFDLSARCLRAIGNSRARAFLEAQYFVGLHLDQCFQGSGVVSVSFDRHSAIMNAVSRIFESYSVDIVLAVHGFVSARCPVSRRSRLQAALIESSEIGEVECVHDEIPTDRLVFLAYWFCVGNWAIAKWSTRNVAELRTEHTSLLPNGSHIDLRVDADGILTITHERDVIEFRQPPFYTSTFRCLD